MKQNAEIKVVGSQVLSGEKNTIEINTTGICEETENGIKLIYKEDFDKDAAVETTFSVKGNLVNIKRTGDFESNMLIQHGKRHHCHYRTPYGDMFMGTYGEELSVKNGNIRLEYTLDLNSSLISRNAVVISYRCKPVTNNLGEKDVKNITGYKSKN